MSSESQIQVTHQLEVKGADPRTISGSDLDRRREVSQVKTQPTFSKEQELLQALMLGLYDYMRKTKSRGFMVSLSGGCDSSTVTITVAHMLAEAVKQDGLEVTCQRLGLQSRGITTVTALIHAALTCIYQGTKNSGPVTLAAAKAVATEVGATFHQIELQPAVDFYQQTVESMIGRSLDWKTDDLAMQNIQARARVPGLWMLANIEHKILLTTSNRSEASVGYATMDGDTAGGLAPIAGIDKNFLRSWLKWAETQTEIGLGALPALQLVNKQNPTAELRPGIEQQTDEADLMPYDVLDRIESAFVRDRLSPEDILDVVCEDFPNLKQDVLAGYVKKFFKLWTQSQWKRERFAPAFHLDEASVDPRTWCRYPILSVAPE
jgi:NAD+ synthase (glutamine-hydrolysing)